MAMGIKRNHEEFVREIEEKFGDVYEFLTEYSGIDNHIKIVHKKCGHTWSTKASYLLNPKNIEKEACPKCNKNVLDTQRFTERVFSLVGDEYVVLGECLSGTKPIRMKHNTLDCQHEYTTKPSYFINNNSRCPICRNKTTVEELKQAVFESLGGSYTVIGEYINSSTKIKVLHNNCGDLIEILPNSLLKEYEKCSNLKCSKITNKYNFSDKVLKKYGDEYIALEDYIDSGTKIRFKHNKKGCGKVFVGSPKHFLYGKTSCPCNHTSSRGEKKISKILKESNTLFKKEFVLSECTDEGFLRFDFALFNSDGSLYCLLEYDGSQHFMPVDFAGRGEDWADDQFKKIQERDGIKNQYCITNNIPLIRIPYWEFDNVEIIISKLINYNDLSLIKHFLVA